MKNYLLSYLEKPKNMSPTETSPYYATYQLVMVRLDFGHIKKLSYKLKAPKGQAKGQMSKVHTSTTLKLKSSQEADLNGSQNKKISMTQINQISTWLITIPI
ncbi:hypothetical protein COCNU_contig69379393G000010 [Cocos nucifera]|nr:hypothetical protein [Cocos nucifera]